MEKLKNCDCEEWKKGMKYIDAMTDLAYIHNMVYAGGQFIYCPWCGKKRIVIDFYEKDDNQ